MLYNSLIKILRGKKMSKRQIASALVQMIIGFLGVVLYIILLVISEPMLKWTVTLILSIAYFIIGLVNFLQIIKRK